jgi:hypothetical protein
MATAGTRIRLKKPPPVSGSGGLGLGALLRIERFLEQEGRQHDGGQTDRRADQIGRPRAKSPGDEAAQGRADRQAEREGQGGRAQAFGPLARLGDIADIGLGGREVAGGDAVQHAGEVDDPDARGKGDDHVTQERAQLGDDQDGPPAISITQPAQDGPDDERHGEVGGLHTGDLGRGRGQFILGVERKDGQGDGEAEGVDKGHQPDQGDRRFEPRQHCVQDGGHTGHWPGPSRSTL